MLIYWLLCTFLILLDHKTVIVADVVDDIASSVIRQLLLLNETAATTSYRVATLILSYNNSDSNDSNATAQVVNEFQLWMDEVLAYRWSDKYNVIFWIGIIPVLAAIASVGSLMVLVVACISSQFRTVSCIFLTNLSAIDVFQTLVIVPFKVMENFVIKFPFNEWWICKFIYVMREALYICYVHTFILIAIERYIVVVYPMKALQLCTKKNARWALLSIWILSIILAMPTAFHTSLIGVEDGWPVCVREIIRRNYPKWFNIELWREIHESYALFLLYVLPFIALIVCYTVVAAALYRSISASKTLTQQSLKNNNSAPDLTSASTNSANSPRKTVPDVQRERILVLRMCIVLVAFFGICQGPWRLQYWLNVVFPDAIRPDINAYLGAPFFALCVLNSAVNPIVYGFMSRNFRQAFVLAIAKWCLVPIRVYQRMSLLRWHANSKESRAKNNEDQRRRKSMPATTSGNHVCEMNLDGKDAAIMKLAASITLPGGSLPERYRCNNPSSENENNLATINIDIITNKRCGQPPGPSPIKGIIKNNNNNTTMIINDGNSITTTTSTLAPAISDEHYSEH